VAIPLWLPGERGRSQALADAEGRAIESRTTAAQLRVAATVREAGGRGSAPAWNSMPRAASSTTFAASRPMSASV
jgi:hypothetical protein